LILFSKSNIEFNYTPVFTFLKRNTDTPDLMPLSCRYICHTSELQEYVRRHDLIAHTTVQGPPEEASGGSFTKIRDPPDESLLISAWNMPPRKPDQNHPSLRISGRTTIVPKKPFKAMATLLAPDELWQDM